MLDKLTTMHIMFGMGQSRIEDELRRIIADSETTRYRIAQETGIDQGALSHFMAHRRGMTPANIEKILDLLGLELSIRPAKRGQNNTGESPRKDG